MPAQVAHDAVRVGLDVGRDVLTFSKSKRLLRPTVELLERPVCAVVTSKAGLVTLAACDRLVSAADRTIDRVMTTSVYKCAVRAVAHNSARTGAWRRRALERYYAMLVRADALVDLYLCPANASKDSVKQPTLVITKRGVSGLATKVARRGHSRIRAAVASASLAVKKSPGVFKKTVAAAVARVKAIPSILCAESLAIGKTIAAQCFAAAGAADQLALRYATTSFLRNLAVSVYQRRISPLVARLLSPAAKSNPASFVRQDVLPTPARSAPPPRRTTYTKDATSASGESTPAPESKSQRPGPALLLTPSGDSPHTQAWKTVGLTTPGSPVAAAVATSVQDGDARSAPRPRRLADSNALLKRAVAGAASTPAPTVPARESSPAPESEAAALLKVDSSLFFSPGLESAHRQAWKSVGLTTPGMPVPDAAAVATPEPDGDACGSPVTPYTPLYLLNM